MEDKYLFKDCSGSVVKDVDVKTGIVTGLFSKFDNVDSDGDIVRKGAYKKSLRENGPESASPRIRHLKDHQTNLPLSKPHVLKEASDGLYFESKISQTTYGKDTLLLYEDGVLDEHSIGYKIIKAHRDEKSGVQELIELQLWEGSTVTWGANEQARVRSVNKGAFKEEDANTLIKKLDTLEKAFHSGKYSDDTFRLIEIEIKQIQQLIIDSLIREEPVITTPTKEPKTIDMDWVINKLKL
jgi:uncharacterized protein